MSRKTSEFYQGDIVVPTDVCTLGLSLYSTANYVVGGSEVTIRPKEPILVIESATYYDKFGNHLIRVLARCRIYYARCQFLTLAYHEKIR